MLRSEAGVFGVPYFVVDGEPIWGVDRMWMVEHWATPPRLARGK